jgi:hypothetical protein
MKLLLIKQACSQLTDIQDVNDLIYGLYKFGLYEHDLWMRITYITNFRQSKTLKCKFSRWQEGERNYYCLICSGINDRRIWSQYIIRRRSMYHDIYQLADNDECGLCLCCLDKLFYYA